MDKKFSAVLTSFVIMALFLTGCGSKAIGWAYSHDPATEIISLSDNGKAVYKGSNYTYTQDSSFITLKGSDGSEIRLRYIPDSKDEGKMLLYEKTTYNYAGEGVPDSFIGAWVDDNNRSSFQFTDKGTFSEDNIFYGHFTADTEESSIKLMYDEPLEDTMIYYSLEGNRLTIDYPWSMVRTGSEGGMVDKGTIK